MLEHNIAVKVIGANGQISLGKQFAGQQVLVEQKETGVWLIRTAEIIPHNEFWLHEPTANKDLAEAMHWASIHPAAESNLQTVAKKIENVHSKRKTNTTRFK